MNTQTASATARPFCSSNSVRSGASLPTLSAAADGLACCECGHEWGPGESSVPARFSPDGGQLFRCAPACPTAADTAYVVVYPPRPVDRGLCAVCRTDHLDGTADHLFELSEMARAASVVEPWDYHAAAQRHAADAERANPEAVAYAKANPTSPAAQWAAYGLGF